MRPEAKMKIAGYLSRDPELRYTPQGDEVLGLDVPFTPRRFDKQSNQYVDAGDTLWVRATLWREEAELYAPKLAKGTAVIIEGMPMLRPWESNGKHGVNLELRFAQVSIVPTAPRRDGQQAPPPAEEAWATPGAWTPMDDTPF